MNNRLSWNNFFLAVCKLCAARSEDPNTKVGACITNEFNQIISTGYNGLPRGLDSDKYPWEREGKDAASVKYTYLVHAELNALTAAYTNVRGFNLYTTLFPCSGCTKIIIQSGIAKVFYIDNKYLDTPDSQAALRMLIDAKIEVIQLADVEVQVSITTHQ